jgi:hypothetical protein
LIVALAITNIINEHSVSAACIEACLTGIPRVNSRKGYLPGADIVESCAFGFAVDIKGNGQICLLWTRFALLRTYRS